MSASRPRLKRRAPRPMPPALTPEHVAGFVLGLALAGMAIDYGLRASAPAPRPVTPALAHFPGP